MHCSECCDQKQTAEVDPKFNGLCQVRCQVSYEKNPMISVWLSDLYLESSSNRVSQIKVTKKL